MRGEHEVGGRAHAPPDFCTDSRVWGCSLAEARVQQQQGQQQWFLPGNSRGWCGIAPSYCQHLSVLETDIKSLLHILYSFIVIMSPALYGVVR